MQVLVDTSGGPFTRELLLLFGIHDDQIVPHVRGMDFTFFCQSALFYVPFVHRPKGLC